MNKLISLIFASFFFLSCAGTNFNWNDAREVRTGMTVNQVTEKMGKPTHITSYGDGTSLYQWVFANGFGGVKQFGVKFDGNGNAISVPQVPNSF